MKTMQEAVEDRRGKHADRGEQDDPRIQRIERGKYFPRIRSDRVDGPHTAEDHGCVEQGIDP